MSAHIQLDREFVAEFCQRNQIRRLALFGSVLTERFRPESDLDVLVEFEPDGEPGFIGLARMQLELEAVVGRPVDFRTPKDLSRFFREEVLRSAEVQYSAA
jgi:predicted nucleotidyltransferase